MAVANNEYFISIRLIRCSLFIAATSGATMLRLPLLKLILENSILYGILIAIPAMLIGHWWAVYAGKKTKTDNVARC